MITPENFLPLACDVLGYDLSLIRSNNRKPRFVKVRIILSYVLKNKFKLSYPDIGDLLHKDHSSIINYLKSYNPEPDDVIIDKLWAIRENQQKEIFSIIAHRINNELSGVDMSDTKRERIGNLLWSIINEEKKLNAQ